MQFKSNIQIKQIGGESVLVSYDDREINYTRVITLNESAEYLISQSLDEKLFSPMIWRDLLSTKYGISKERALVDTLALIEKLKEADVLVL
ncbi:MAG: PqqD family protein [Bacteroidia bacterium]|nr:PqqD family protein [Bacteroidia bacterium]